MNNQIQSDPWDSASKAELKPAEYYGQVSVDVWFCALVKGTGKVPFDPKVHKIEERRTAIDLVLTPLDPDAKFTPERHIIAESREWAGITWASLKALGLQSLKDLHGKFAKVTFVPTGRKYLGADGEIHESTAFKFLALYDTREQCEAARGKNNGANAPANTEPAAATSERDVAWQFVQALAKAARGNRDVLAKQIAAYPVVNKYFTVDSPEVAQLLAQAA
jgi:hypothetical protein